MGLAVVLWSGKSGALARLDAFVRRPPSGRIPAAPRTLGLVRGLDHRRKRTSPPVVDGRLAQEPSDLGGPDGQREAYHE